MTDRRQFLRVACAAPLAVTGLVACAPTRPLVIGIHPWPGYEPLLLARDFGWLPPLAQLEEGGNAGDSIAGLRAGRLDAACLTLDEVLSVRAGGLPLTVVLVLNESVGADVVLARPGIRSLADLKGRRLAVEKSAVGGIVLKKLLAAAGLRMEDLHLLSLPVDRHLDLWRRNEIDAAISFSPYADYLVREGAVRIYDSRQFPQTIFDTLAVRGDHLREHAATLRATVAAHLRALDHLRVNREDAMRRIAARRKLRFEEVEAGYAGLHLPDLMANRRALSASGSLSGAAGTLAAFMVENGLLPGPDNLAGLTTDAYLPRQN